MTTPADPPPHVPAAGGTAAPAETKARGAGAEEFPRQHARTRGFTLGRPRSFTVAADGRVALLRSLAADDPVLRLWVLDPDADTPRLVADPLTLDHPDRPSRVEGAAAGTAVTAAERARRERAREQAGGIVTYATDAAVRRAVFTFDGRLYVAELTAPTDRPSPAGARSAGGAGAVAADDPTGGGADAAGGGAVVRVLPAAAAAHDPRLDPTGTRVAYVAGGGLYVTGVDAASPPQPAARAPADPATGSSAEQGAGGDVDGGRVPLVAEPDAGVSWGVAEFVAAEEMGRSRGFWWSPDGTRLAVTRVDEREVPRWYLADPAVPEQPPRPQAYPAAGTVNARVRLFVLDLAGGRVEVGWDHAALPYLVAVRWDAHAPLTLVVQSRDQRTLKVLTADPDTGLTTVAHTQTDRAWVSLLPGVPRWLPPATPEGVARLLTTVDDPAGGQSAGDADRHGQRHGQPAHGHREGAPNDQAAVEGVVEGSAAAGGDDATGSAGAHEPADTDTAPDTVPDPDAEVDGGWGTRRLAVDGVPVTPPGLQVRRVLAAAAEEVVFAGSRVATQVHLWRVRLGDGHLTQLTRTPGVHDGAAAGATLVVTSTSLTGPPTVRVRRPGGQEVELPAAHATPLVAPRPRLLRTTARRLHTALLLPADGRADRGVRLPVLLDPYGGPGAQRVLHSQLGFATAQWFADQGFAVVVTDGRGTPGRGPGWERTVHRDVAGPVLADQVDALHDLAARHPALDLGWVAIRGWSFGGYLAALAVLRRPDVFHAAVAGAPVTDWRLYDTHYTERYLGHPDTDPESYERSSLLADADRLRRPLLLVHGLADDNVVAAHTLRLSAALLAAGRPHTVLPLSGVTHMTPQQVAENLLRLQLAFLRSALHLDTSTQGTQSTETAAAPAGTAEPVGRPPPAAAWPTGG